MSVWCVGGAQDPVQLMREQQRQRQERQVRQQQQLAEQQREKEALLSYRSEQEQVRHVIQQLVSYYHHRSCSYVVPRSLSLSVCVCVCVRVCVIVCVLCLQYTRVLCAVLWELLFDLSHDDA